MFTAYLKKLGSSFFFMFIYFLFYWAVALVWTQISTACKENFGLVFGRPLNYAIIIILTLLVELLAVYVVRIDNLKAKESYEETHAPSTYSRNADFKETLKSKEHILHAAAFGTVMLPFFLLIGLGTKAGTTLLIVCAIAATIICTALFVLISSWVWCIVHKKWLSNKEPKDFKKLWNAIINKLKGWS